MTLSPLETLALRCLRGRKHLHSLTIIPGEARIEVVERIPVMTADGIPGGQPLDKAKVAQDNSTG